MCLPARVQDLQHVLDLRCDVTGVKHVPGVQSELRTVRLSAGSRLWMAASEVTRARLLARKKATAKESQVKVNGADRSGVFIIRSFHFCGVLSGDVIGVLRTQGMFHRFQENNFIEGVSMVGFDWLFRPRRLRVLHGPRERGYGMRHPLSLNGGSR